MPGKSFFLSSITRLIALVVLLTFLSAEATSALGTVSIGDVKLNAPTTVNLMPSKSSRLQSLLIRSSSVEFKMLGAGRDNFSPADWVLAWTGYPWPEPRPYKVEYAITVYEHLRLRPGRLLSTWHFTRTATPIKDDFGKWPDGIGIWIEIQLEDGTKVYPKTVAEAKAMMFDVSAPLAESILKLTEGQHTLYATVQASCTGWHFECSDSARSSTVTVKVTR